MNPPQISIIIPVYNSQKYLRECLNSIQAQEFSDFEVLLIDDGSTDNSWAICEEFSADDSRFKAFSKENEGVSSARNLGIDEATGDWIWFIDSDDYIRKDAVEILQKAIEKNETDGLIFGYQKVSPNGNSIYMFDKKGKIITLNQNETLKLMYQSVHYPYQGYVWSKLFKRSIIKKHKIKFNAEIYFNEDRLFCVEYYSKCTAELTYLLEDLYFYLDADDSAMNRITKSYNTKFETDVKAFMLMHEVLKMNHLKQIYKVARVKNIFASKRLFEMRRKFQIPVSEIDEYLKKVLSENFKWSDYLGRNIRLGYLNWKFIKSIKK